MGSFGPAEQSRPKAHPYRGRSMAALTFSSIPEAPVASRGTRGQQTARETAIKVPFSAPVSERILHAQATSDPDRVLPWHVGRLEPASPPGQATVLGTLLSSQAHL